MNGGGGLNPLRGPSAALTARCWNDNAMNRRVTRARAKADAGERHAQPVRFNESIWRADGSRPLLNDRFASVLCCRSQALGQNDLQHVARLGRHNGSPYINALMF